MRARASAFLSTLLVALMVLALTAGESMAGPDGVSRLRSLDSAGRGPRHGLESVDGSQQRVEVLAGQVGMNEPEEQPVECLQSDIWFLGRTTDYAGPELPPPPVGAPLVAILDTAVDGQHPALRNLLDAGYDFVDEDDDPSLPPEVLSNPEALARPGYLHATSVAGTVAALAPGLRLAVYRVLDGNCLGSYSGLARGIEQAVEDGAVIILAPLGSHEWTGEVRHAVDLAEDSDVLIIAAAGNDATQMVTHLARRKSVIAVAAVDSEGLMAPFSSYGPHVSVADYGDRLEVLVPARRLTEASGTSLAAARTAAAAGVVRGVAPSLTAVEVKALLEDTAAPLSPEEDHKLGAGVTDLDAARLAAELLTVGN